MHTEIFDLKKRLIDNPSVIIVQNNNPSVITVQNNAKKHMFSQSQEKVTNIENLTFTSKDYTINDQKIYMEMSSEVSKIDSSFAEKVLMAEIDSSIRLPTSESGILSDLDTQTDSSIPLPTSESGILSDLDTQTLFKETR